MGFGYGDETEISEEGPSIESGVAYGEPVPGDERNLVPLPLESGVVHAARAELWGCTPWDDEDTECNTLVGAGCGSFTPGA